MLQLAVPVTTNSHRIICYHMCEALFQCYRLQHSVWLWHCTYMAYQIDQPVQLMRVLGERCNTAKTCHTHCTCSYNIQQTLAPMPRNKLLNMFHVGAAVVCLIFTAERLIAISYPCIKHRQFMVIVIKHETALAT